MELTQSNKKLRFNYMNQTSSLISSFPITFCLESYASRYSAFALINRLALLAEYCPRFAQASLALALLEIKKTTIGSSLYADTHKRALFLKERYIELGIYQQDPAPIEDYDMNWVSNADETYKTDIQKLESDLNIFKASLVKNSVRIGLIDIANLYYRAGDFSSASKTLQRAEECCVDFSQLLEMYYLTTKVFISSELYKAVLSNFKKVDSIYTSSKITENKTSFYAFFAISSMASGAYRQALDQFIKLDYSELNSFDGFTCNLDIGIYGAFCALATASRAEIKSLLLENKNFVQYLDHDSNLYDMLNYFYNGSYSKFSQLLEQKLATLVIDIFFHKQINIILKMIQKNIIIHYIQPRITADLQIMYKCCLFDSVQALENELICMISSKVIYARLDLVTYHLEIDTTQPETSAASSTFQDKDFDSNIDNKLNIVQKQIKESKTSNLTGTLYTLDSLLICNEQLAINRELNKNNICFKINNLKLKWPDFL
ncbi:hypothetical protein BB561_001444 [Smittium simulii]|uniref:PCI domain-containing protein n=1 Tax=Smittium simulii TaxID=133385 RepID=A0A2T9YUP0_9FUNG|nr:hypothetical protein BB561_001444 [Smittium simulii]